MMGAILLSIQRLHLAPSLPLSFRRSQPLSTTVVMRKHKLGYPWRRSLHQWAWTRSVTFYAPYLAPSHVLHSEPLGLGKLYGVSFISFSILGGTLTECKFSLGGNSSLTDSMEYISLLIGETRTVWKCRYHFSRTSRWKKKEIKGIKEVKRGSQCTKDTSQMSSKDKLFSVIFVPLLICSKPSVLSGFRHPCMWTSALQG